MSERSFQTVSVMLAVTMNVAGRFLDELVLERRDGPWMAALKAELIEEAKNMDIAGVSFQRESELYKAVLIAVDLAFSKYFPVSDNKEQGT